MDIPTEKKEEEKTEQIITRREKKFITWLKNPYNSALVGILILAFLIRIYYFILTKNQPLWWDELVFGDLAKNFINPPWANSAFLAGELLIRPLFMPILWAGLLFLRLGEPAIRFILEIIPSLLSVLFIYLIGKEFFDKKTALVAAFILSVSWIHLFYSLRLLTSVPAILFSLISIYAFIKSFENEKINRKFFAISIFSLMLAFLMRYNFAILGIAYLIYLLYARKLSFLKDKNFWIGGIIGIIPLLIFLFINRIITGSFFKAIMIYAQSSGAKSSFAYYTLGFIPHVLQSVFFILFLIGLIIALLDLVLGYDRIRLSRKLQGEFFMVLLMILNLAFLIFYIKYAEDRYLFECMVSFIFIISIAVVWIFSLVRKYSRVFAIILIAILLFAGAYTQYSYGDNMIKTKAVSYLEMKEAFTWMKYNLPHNSTFLGSGAEPYAYYADMTPVKEPANETGFPNAVSKADYLIWNAFTTQPDYFVKYLQGQNLTIVNAFFFDAQKTQPAVIILKNKA